MNALRQNLLPTLALIDAQSEQSCQVNRDLSMERRHEKKVNYLGGRKPGEIGTGDKGEFEMKQVL